MACGCSAGSSGKVRTDSGENVGSVHIADSSDQEMWILGLQCSAQRILHIEYL
jgi:hypothetical protein